jgi:hypothetical protein
MLHASFQHPVYLLRRQVLALTGTFHLYAPGGQLVLFSRQKMFRVKEDIRVFTDENMAQDLLWIKARHILDFSAAYDVFDCPSGNRIGTLQRKGFRSLLRDAWEILDAAGRPLAILQEDSFLQALLRRLFLGSLLPQAYEVYAGDRRVAGIRQRFNPIRYQLDLDFSLDPSQILDRRLGIAAGLLLGTIEGKQE